MKPLRGTVWGCALLLVGLTAAPADAAWCNVFQVCWHRHKAAPAVSYYAAPAPCCDPCPPQPCCTTRYVQRCYYQPVTTYQTKSYYEPVTTYRTSYYYEPVTSYKYTSYYDPCSCSCQQVAVPTTCYQLRSQCCPVQSWVQRCCSVPVTSYQQSFYWEPVTCCSTPAPAAPAADCAAQVPLVPGAVPQPGVVTQPGVGESRGTVPGVSESPGRVPGFQGYQNLPQSSGGSLRLLPPQAPVPAQPVPPSGVKLDRIASNSTSEVQGKVVRGDSLPIGQARLLFVNADRREPRRTAETDANGQFSVKLASGGWLVYIHGADGHPVFHRKIEVNDGDRSPLLLVNR
jgi:hypothetical protein